MQVLDGEVRFTAFESAVHDVVRRVPVGRVTTYGDVAAAVGRPGAARAVGQVMRCNPDTHVTPCHRVVASDGTLGGYNGSWAYNRRKVSRLLEEGIRVTPEGRVVEFASVRWRPGSD